MCIYIMFTNEFHELYTYIHYATLYIAYNHLISKTIKFTFYQTLHCQYTKGYLPVKSGWNKYCQLTCQNTTLPAG